MKVRVNSILRSTVTHRLTPQITKIPPSCSVLLEFRLAKKTKLIRMWIARKKMRRTTSKCVKLKTSKKRIKFKHRTRFNSALTTMSLLTNYSGRYMGLKEQLLLTSKKTHYWILSRKSIWYLKVSLFLLSLCKCLWRELLKSSWLCLK